MFRAAFLTCLLALPAAADCVTQADLAKGISFTRQDGHVGRIQTQGGTLQVDYVTDRHNWFDSRTTRFGIFETHFSSYKADSLIVGSLPPEFTVSFSPQPGAPQPDKSWSAKMHQVETDVGFGAEMVRLVSRVETDFAVKYSFLTAGEAKLSGCTYRILPVEATFTGKDGKATRRWIYFPDLGFGLETVRDGVKNGLIALVAE